MFEEIPTQENIEQRVRSNMRLCIPSRFGFLNEIIGLRPDGIHGLLATTGAGKSTLLRSIIADTTEAVKTLILLSEENPITYFAGFGRQKETVRSEQIQVVLEKTIADFSENTDERFRYLFEVILLSECKFIFWDNVTASRVLGDTISISRKGEYFLKLIDFLKEHSIGLFYVIHTDKTIGKNQTNIFSGNNARGSDAIRMSTEYFFIMQGWLIREKVHNFITIEKHREHAVKNKVYLLKYKNETYVGDVVSNYEQLNMASRYMADAMRKLKVKFEENP